MSNALLRLRFEHRAVAFLDVLGFRVLVEAAEKNDAEKDRLERLLVRLRANRQLNAAVSRRVPRRLRPKSVEISDSIILSTPLRDPGMPLYSGLHVLAMRCAQVATILLDEGFLVSGGIAIGPMHHEDRNIVGTGYQSAYALQTTVVSPTIVLSEDATAEWFAPKHGGAKNFNCLEWEVEFRSPAGKGIAVRKALVINPYEPLYVQSALGNPGHRGKIDVDGRWLKGKIGQLRDAMESKRSLYAAGEQANAGIERKWAWALAFLDGPARDHLEAFYDDELAVP